MIVTFFKRLFNRSQPNVQRSADGRESMLIATPVAAAPIHSTDDGDDDVEAVEGDVVDTSNTGGEATCGSSCGAMFP